MSVIAPEHRVVLIRIPKTAPADGDPAALYEATREWWKIAEKWTTAGSHAPTHALAVLKGQVIAAYAIDRWEQRPEDGLRRFHGRPAEDEVARYVGQDVKDYFPNGAQTAIRYVNCEGAKPLALAVDRPAVQVPRQRTAPGFATTKHTQPWVQVDDADERQAAAEGLAWLATRPGFHEQARRRLLKELWWFLTEWGGKYGTRYRSVAALEVQISQSPGSWPKLLRHEHAIPRKLLSQQLLAGDRTQEAQWEVMRRAVACIVTIEEDKAITAFDNTHAGWERYVQAGVSVVDMATGAVLTPADIAATLVTVED